jgi:MEDS: MEthanogen/methylotroph, DcmR Sensory domain
MKQPPHPISMAGSRLGEARQVCAFFANDDEEYRVLLPFIREGLSCGDKPVQVVNPAARQDHLRRLAEAGIDASAPQQNGQPQIPVNTEVYLRDGRFNQDRMLEVFEEMAASARSAEGFTMSGVVCRMDWASADQFRIDDVIEFESRVNDLCRRYDDAVICTYHLSKLSGDAVIDIMRTHPTLIIGGISSRTSFSCVLKSSSMNFADGGLEEKIPCSNGRVCTNNQQILQLN